MQQTSEHNLSCPPSASRRYFLKTGLLLTLAGNIIIQGLLTSVQALANIWPRQAFDAAMLQDSLKNLFGHGNTAPSNKITIDGPVHVENGASVPLRISTTIRGAESITVLAEDNPQPLIAQISLHAPAKPYFRLQIKMAGTSSVHAIVKANNKLYATKKVIKVSVGGCTR